MDKRAHKRTYIDVNTSDSDPAVNITSIRQITSQTSKWSAEECISLNIRYADACNINDIIHTTTDVVSDETFSTLLLDDLDKRTLSTADEHTITYDSNGNKRGKKVITIIRKMRDIINTENATSIRETKVDSFVMTLFEYIGFDDDPFLMHPQYDYTVVIGHDHRITSKVDYMVTKRDVYIVFVVEDKHPKGTSELTNWSEHQIAGEIFGSAYHNVDIGTHSSEVVSYPLCIHAIRIIGTEFTFYRSDVTKEYLTECAKGLPSKHCLIIKRFPAQPEDTHNTVRKLNAWDFCNPRDRYNVLSTLKALTLK